MARQPAFRISPLADALLLSFLDGFGVVYVCLAKVYTTRVRHLGFAMQQRASSTCDAYSGRWSPFRLSSASIQHGVEPLKPSLNVDAFRMTVGGWLSSPCGDSRRNVRFCHAGYLRCIECGRLHEIMRWPGSAKIAICKGFAEVESTRVRSLSVRKMVGAPYDFLGTVAG